MTPYQVELIKSSWKKVCALDTVTVGKLFYSRLFEIAPEVKPLFTAPVADQSKKLLGTLSYIIHKLDRLEDIVQEVMKLAERHVHYGVKREHYTAVGEALIWTLQKGLGEEWNPELEKAWLRCYATLSSAMIAAAGYAEHEAA